MLRSLAPLIGVAPLPNTSCMNVKSTVNITQDPHLRRKLEWGLYMGADGPHAVHVQPVNDASSMLCCAGNSIPAPTTPHRNRRRAARRSLLTGVILLTFVNPIHILPKSLPGPGQT